MKAMEVKSASPNSLTSKRSLQAAIQKCKVNLIYSGLMIIIFQGWGMARIVLMKFIEPSEYSIVSNMIMGSESSSEIPPELVFLYLLTTYLIGFLVYSYFGIRAIQEGRGKKSGKYYIVFAAVLFLIDLISSIYSLMVPDAAHPYRSMINTIIQLLGDAGLLIMVISAVKLKILEKKAKKDRGEPHEH